MAELVDLYKTFSDAAGLPAPEASVGGKSLAPLLDDVDAPLPGGDVAWSQYARCPKDDQKLWDCTGGCKNVARKDITYMGYSMRTGAWRYTAWLKFDGAADRGKWEACGANATAAATSLHDASSSDFCERELYAHGDDEDMADFENFEPKNLAALPEHAGVVQSLHARLKAFFDS